MWQDEYSSMDNCQHRRPTRVAGDTCLRRPTGTAFLGSALKSSGCAERFSCGWWRTSKAFWGPSVCCCMWGYWNLKQVQLFPEERGLWAPVQLAPGQSRHTPFQQVRTSTGWLRTLLPIAAVSAGQSHRPCCEQQTETRALLWWGCATERRPQQCWTNCSCQQPQPKGWSRGTLGRWAFAQRRWVLGRVCIAKQQSYGRQARAMQHQGWWGRSTRSPPGP